MGARRKRERVSLQSAIRAKNYDWTAGDTTLSALSASEQKSWLGLHVTTEELDATAGMIAASEGLARVSMAAPAAPPAIDWRNNGGNWVTLVRNQQSCGSCVSFATLATIESRLSIVCRNASLKPDLSEAFLFYCGCGNCCGTGWNFPPALDFCKNTGYAQESSFPYTPGNQPCKSGVPIYSKLSSWAAKFSVADRKDSLSSKGPMVAGMAVYQDFFSYVSGVYRHTTGSLAGYHAVSVIGYDDAQQCWICKNSWGTNWGDQGFFRIGYGECGMDTQFAMYEVDPPCVAPVTDCTRYVELLRRVLIMAKLNPTLRACLRTHVCRRPGRACPPAYLPLVKAVIAILARCPQYRAPFCRVIG